MKSSLRLGTRASALAQTQAHWVADRLRATFKDLQIEIVLITTSGDTQPDPNTQNNTPLGPGPKLEYTRSWGLAPMGGLKTLFTKEIEDALLGGRIDLAVHSMKDLPGELPAGLEISAVPEREDVRDVWISKTKTPFKNLPPKARIATGAVRRQAQLKRHRKDLEILPLRGNVDARLAKLQAGDFDGMVLALAGLKRLGREDAVTEILSTNILLPAIGQGALALEIRSNDPERSHLTAALNHLPSQQAILAERGFLKALGGSCQTPIAAHATVEGSRLMISGLVVAPAGDPGYAAQLDGPVVDAEALGKKLAHQLLAAGADKILFNER